MKIDTIRISQTDIQVLDGDRGINYPKKSDFNERGYCLFLDASNVTPDGFRFTKPQFISKEKSEKLKNGKLKRNDVVLTSRGTIGNFGYYSDDVPYEHIRINSGMLIIRSNNDFDSGYLYHLLKSDYIKKQITNITTGSSQPQITQAIVRELTLLKPEKNEQELIAKVLNALEDKISLNNQINDELEKTARLIYGYWFIQFDFPNDNGNPHKTSGGSMIHSHALKREVPTGWNITPMSENAKVIMGQSPKGSSYNESKVGIPLLNGPADYKNGSLVGRIYTTEPTRLCIKNDLVFCIRATIGKLTYAEKEFCLGRGVAAVRPNVSAYLEYIYFTLLQEIERFKIQAGGSIIVGITKDDLADCNVLIPPLEIIEKFHEITKPIFDKIRANKKQNLELISLRDWLLPMLLTGQIKVKAS